MVCYVYLATNDIIVFGGAQAARNEAALLSADLYAAGADFVYFTEPMNRQDTCAAQYLANTGPTFDADRLALRTIEQLNLPAYHNGAVAPNESVLGRSTSPDNDFYFALGDLDGLSKVHLTAAGNHWYAEAIAQNLAVRLSITLPAITLPTLLNSPSGTADTGYDAVNHRACRSGGGACDGCRWANLALGDISTSEGFVGNNRIPNLVIANCGVVTGLE